MTWMGGDAAAMGAGRVATRVTRRHVTASYKPGIVVEANTCETPGEIEAVFRREGLCSSHLPAWQKVTREGSLCELARERGRGPAGVAMPRGIPCEERRVGSIARISEWAGLSGGRSGAVGA